MKADVLRLIRSTKEYMSLMALTEACKMSEDEVYNAVTQLMNMGYDIEYEEDKGFHLNSYPENITAVELMSRVKTEWAGKNVMYKKSTGSTNDDAKNLSGNKNAHGILVVTDHQTSGKGRRGRVWEDNGQGNIAMSLLLKPKCNPDQASRITLIMALAVADVIAQLTEGEVKIKWPNDVLVNKKKVCGILTEMGLNDKGEIDHVVVGVGINVNQKYFPEELNHASSLYIENEEVTSARSDIILGVMDYFEYYYNMFEEFGDLSHIVTMYESYLINKDEKVKVLDPKGEYTGTATGINDFGELIVQKDEGGFARVDSGEVSVRGVYGYV